MGNLKKDQEKLKLEKHRVRQRLKLIRADSASFSKSTTYPQFEFERLKITPENWYKAEIFDLNRN